jgi:hypothetical protein
LKLIRCQKCGTAIISDETLLQNVLEKMNDAVRRAQKCKAANRPAILQEAAEYRSIYKALMHNITSRERAEMETPFVLSAITRHLVEEKILTQEEVDHIANEGRQRARAARRRYDAEIKKTYGDFECAANRTKADPTASRALNNVERRQRK